MELCVKSGDFPVSVISSRASTYPDFVTLPVDEQPPMSQIASLPVELQASIKDRDGKAHPPPAVPDNAFGPSNKEIHEELRQNGETYRLEEHEDSAGSLFTDSKLSSQWQSSECPSSWA